MEEKTKSIEMVGRPEVAASHGDVITRQPGNPVRQGRYATFNVQRTAGNLAVQRLARQAAGSTPPQAGPATYAALQHTRRGAPLPTSIRAHMENAFHGDFSAVNIHTDAQASRAASELNAQAFTLGQDIYFGAGRYQPDIAEGQQLLAHELTHTIQQGAGQPSIAGKLETSQPGDASEQEAERAAEAIVQGKPLTPTQDRTMQIARQPVDAGVATQIPDAGTSPTAPVVSPPTQGPSPVPAPGSPITPQPAPIVSPPTAAPSPIIATAPPDSTTEIIFPPFTVFKGEEKTVELLALPPLSSTLWEELIELPPPLFLAVVGLYAKIGFKLELFLRYGPAVIREIRLALDPTNNRYSGTGQFYMPVAIAPRATLRGSLTGKVNWLRLVEVLAIEGGLNAVGQAPLILAIGPSVNLIYDNGTFSFNLRPQIEAGIALLFDLDAFAQARLVGDVVWKRMWNLYHWQWGRAVRFGTLISLDYIHGSLQPIRTQDFGERISIDELLQGLKEPAKGSGVQVIRPGKRPLQERLRELLDTSGGDPHVILAALAEGSDSEKAAVLADASMMQSLQSAIGNELWPTTQRILANAPSETVPSLDEGTVFIANRHIALGRFQDALQAVVSRLQARGFIDATLCTFTYTRETTEGEGLTTASDTTDPYGMPVPSGPSQVQIYDPAFVNVPWLYSSIMHEYVHVLQFQTSFPPPPTPDDENLREVEAYLWEIEHARGSGVITSPAQMQDLGRRLTAYFNALDPDRTQPIYRNRYNDAIALVRDATSGVAPVNLTYSIDNARKRVQASSREIAELVKKRPPAGSDIPEEARIDGLIAELQRERAEALVEVVLAENPTVQIEDRSRGIYRVPVVDGTGRVRWVYGSIIVVWHLQRLSPSVFTIGAAIRSLPPGTALPQGTSVISRLLVGGSGIQSRAQPFPGDIDFAEEFDITAPDAASAGAALAVTIVDFVQRNVGNPKLEFVELLIMFKGKKGTWNQAKIFDPKQRAELARQLASTDEGRVNTFWHALIEGERPGQERYIEITKLLSLHAISSVTGDDIFKTEPSGAEFQEAYLDAPPPQIDPSMLGWYAQLMRKQAIEKADKGDYLKAAKRAFNYLRTIGNLEGVAAVTPIFATGEASINQQVAVLEAIAVALNPRTPSRILTVEIARNRLNETAASIAMTMPDEAANLRTIAAALRGVKGRESDPLAPDSERSADLAWVIRKIKTNINRNLKVQVADIIDRYVR